MQPPAVQRSIPGPADDDSHHYEEPVAMPTPIHQPDVPQTMPDNDPYIPDMADQSSSPLGQWSIHVHLFPSLLPLQLHYEETSTEAAPI
jgi:hypothetical protein